eukprot:13313304-Alexandrium_andersonii.AAC.1
MHALACACSADAAVACSMAHACKHRAQHTTLHSHARAVLMRRWRAAWHMSHACKHRAQHTPQHAL